jgi:SpoVK/Ycf46/Vps4 family AAA+-type ATPase
MPVYRVDLSQMVSKWIGETEKNLARIFDQAEKQKWILFFDEADALFSKRGTVNSSNDRRANQEISYLLQRVENYDGTIIMATNLKDNIDEAFIRRFQLMINFPVPDKGIRKQLWESILADTFPLDPDLDLIQIAEDYEITGGSMKNIFRSLMLHIIDQEKANQVVTHSGLEMMIQRELVKSGVYTIKRRY